MSDILFKTDDYVFSYRAAGICIQNGKVLLQKPANDEGYAFPGGHCALGETNEETLIREWKEEIGADISVGELKWVAENFFPWGGRTCHQICLYYEIEIRSDNIPRSGSFKAKECLEGRNFDMDFTWIPLDEVKNILLYPTNCAQLLLNPDKGVQHFVYKEE